MSKRTSNVPEPDYRKGMEARLGGTLQQNFNICGRNFTFKFTNFSSFQDSFSYLDQLRPTRMILRPTLNLFSSIQSVQVSNSSLSMLRYFCKKVPILVKNVLSIPNSQYRFVSRQSWNWTRLTPVPNSKHPFISRQQRVQEILTQKGTAELTIINETTRPNNGFNHC